MGNIIWFPKSVEKPIGISLNSFTILISVPGIVSMCSVLYVKNGMSKASFSECRVSWLWFCIAATQIMFISDIASWNKTRKQSRIVHKSIKDSCMERAYMVAKPSMFPPSPMFMYTGADSSSFGVQIPFVILYAIFETRFWYKQIQTNQL